MTLLYHTMVSILTNQNFYLKENIRVKVIKIINLKPNMKFNKTNIDHDISNNIPYIIFLDINQPFSFEKNNYTGFLEIKNSFEVIIQSQGIKHNRSAYFFTLI